MSVVDKIRILEAVVRTPTYTVVGYTHARLVYLATAEGATDIWSIDPATGEKARLTEGGVQLVARPVEESPLLVYTRDVSGGRELQRVFAVDLRGGDERVLVDAPPMRVFGLGFDGRRVAFSGATEEEVSLYLAGLDGSCEKLCEVEGIATVTDVNERYVVGFGVLKGDPRAMELFLYDLSTGEFSVYTPREGSVNRTPRLRGSKLLFETTALGGAKLVVYDADEGTLAEAELAYRDYHEYGPTEHTYFDWTEDGKILAVGVKNGRSRVFVDGRYAPLPEGTISGAAVHGDKLYAAVSSLVTPHRVYEVDLETMERRVVIDNRLPPDVEERLGRVRFVTYRSYDGLEIPTYVVESRAEARPHRGLRARRPLVPGGRPVEVLNSIAGRLRVPRGGAELQGLDGVRRGV